jgi:ABC-2 type transport system ATP-binding protein
MICIENLHFAYKKQSALFHDLSLTLTPGSICGLLGKNGAGKTTLLKMMSGLIFPQSGQVRLMDSDPRKREASFLRELFFVTEEFSLPKVSIKTYTKLFSPFYPSFSRERFDSYLKEFEIEAAQKIYSLSFGQRKKFLLAFAFAANTKVLILDEPSNSLDIPSKGQLRRILASQIREDRTIIISTHQIRDLESLIDPIVIMDRGKIIFQASLADIGDRLIFGSLPESPENALYAEKGPTGSHYIAPRESGEMSNVDMELLFNGVIQNSSGIGRLFNTKGENHEN